MGVCLVLGVEGSCWWLEKRVEGLGWGMGWLGNSLVPAAGCLLGRQPMGQLGAGAGAAGKGRGAEGGFRWGLVAISKTAALERPCSLPRVALADTDDQSAVRMPL